MIKVSSLLFLSLIWMNSAQAANELVQVPEQCLEKEKAPCLVRALQDQAFVTPSQIKIYFSSGALMKVTQFPETALKVELVQGKIIIQHEAKIPFYVNTVNVGSADTYYLKKSGDETELYKMIEARFMNVTRSEDMDLVETKDFASRKSTMDFMNQFTNIPAPLYKLTLEKYEVQLNDEVHNQSRILQRKVAADEAARRTDAEARQKQNVENKKLKALFFMRTFEK